MKDDAGLTDLSEVQQAMLRSEHRRALARPLLYSAVLVVLGSIVGDAINDKD